MAHSSLDEVTEMSPESVDLLRVLESRQFLRVGGEDIVHCDSRIVSATNKSVAGFDRWRLFRDDLFYRLNVIPILVPSLCQQRGNSLLVEHFLHHFCQRHQRPMTHPPTGYAGL
ncbi:MAG: sigma 54-interacting transcriptional regulator [Pirellulaceae bacterium]